jgi:hypothetical protein
MRPLKYDEQSEIDPELLRHFDHVVNSQWRAEVDAQHQAGMIDAGTWLLAKQAFAKKDLQNIADDPETYQRMRESGEWDRLYKAATCYETNESPQSRAAREQETMNEVTLNRRKRERDAGLITDEAYENLVLEHSRQTNPEPEPEPEPDEDVFADPSQQIEDATDFIEQRNRQEAAERAQERREANARGDFRGGRDREQQEA